MASKTFISGGTDNNWGTANNWSPVASVPASGDDVIFNSSSPNCAVNVTTNNLKSLTMTGYTYTLSGSSNITVIGATSATNACLFAGTITWTGMLVISPTTSTSQINITNGGMTTCGGMTISATAASPIYFLDAINISATKTFTFTMGTLHLDGLSDNTGLTHSVGLFSSSNSNTRALLLGNCNLNLTGTGTVLNLDTETGLTLTQGNSTIMIADTSSNSKTMDFGATASISTAKTLNNLTITGGGTGAVIFNTASSNGVIFNNFTIGAPKTVTFTASKTFTFNGTFSAVGTSLNGITIGSSTTSSTTLNFGTSSVFTTNYVTSSWLTASGTALPYIWGQNSTIGVNTSGFGCISFALTKVTPSLIFYVTAAGVVTRTPGVNAVQLFPATGVGVNDYVAFTINTSPTILNHKFNSLILNIATAFAASSYNGIWEYCSSNGTALTWKTLSVTDGTNGFSTVGINTVSFTPPTDWYNRPNSIYAILGSGETTGSSFYKFFIRYRITAVSGQTAGGITAASSTAVQVIRYSIDYSGFTALAPCTMTAINNANSLNGWGMVTKVDQQYSLACTLYDNSNCYFSSKSEQIQFKQGCFYYSAGVLLVGNLISGPYVNLGSSFVFESDACDYYGNLFGSSSLSTFYNIVVKHINTLTTGVGSGQGTWGWGA